MKKLFFQTVTRFLLSVILLFALIFLPAGTLKFFNGWLFMAILFVPMLFIGIFLFFKNPELLKKRLNLKEKQKEQSLVIKLSSIMFVCGFVVAGLGVRLNWLLLPRIFSIFASLVFLFGYFLYFTVLKQNAFLSRTVELQENHKVIDTGLYKIVRHPMYSATLLMFLSMPLVLGSVFAFAIFLIYPFIIAKRIKNEETFLEKELLGYAEYKQKVKYKIIPFLW